MILNGHASVVAYLLRKKLRLQGFILTSVHTIEFRHDPFYPGLKFGLTSFYILPH